MMGSARQHRGTGLPWHTRGTVLGCALRGGATENHQRFEGVLAGRCGIRIDAGHGT